MKTHNLLTLCLSFFIFSIGFFPLTSLAIVFEAENYDTSFDLSPGNNGGVFRQDNVDIEPTTDEGGGFNVGWIEAGEWLRFHQFKILTTGTYQINLRVASVDGAAAEVRLNSRSAPLGQFTIPATGDPQNWTTVSHTAEINQGTYDLNIIALSDGWSINFIEIIPLTSQSSSSASNSSANSSLSETDSDRSLFVHDEATFQNADFTLRSTLAQLVSQLNDANPTQTTSVEDLFARLWDTQNPAPGVITGGQKCTGQLNGFPIVCRPTEGDQARDPASFINNYQPIGLINRFDLRDRVSFLDCGEYRIIYALVGTGQRNFIIFEAQLPNPIPGSADGCLPVAQFWQGLSDENNPEQRALQLRDFYYQGLPADNVIPIVNFSNYTQGTGQIRTNQFMETVWLLKEFKITIDQEGVSTIDAVSVKSNPVDFLFDAQSADFRSPDFQADFVDNMDSLLTDFNSFSLTVANDAHNNGQSHASGSLFTENMFSTPFFGSSNDRFRQEVNNKLAASGSDLSANQVIARATAMTCAGCHNPGSFGLTAPDAVGPEQRWPDTLGFTHINEFALDGVFPLSPALTNVFLPTRKDDLRQYLLNTPASNQSATMQSLSGQPAAARMLNRTTPKKIKPSKRSG